MQVNQHLLLIEGLTLVSFWRIDNDQVTISASPFLKKIKNYTSTVLKPIGAIYGRKFGYSTKTQFVFG